MFGGISGFAVKRRSCARDKCLRTMTSPRLFRPARRKLVLLSILMKSDAARSV